jgi:hypothetical protein
VLAGPCWRGGAGGAVLAGQCWRGGASPEWPGHRFRADRRAVTVAEPILAWWL